MVILQANVNGVFTLETERHPPVAGHRDGVSAPAFPFKGVESHSRVDSCLELAPDQRTGPLENSATPAKKSPRRRRARRRRAADALGDEAQLRLASIYRIDIVRESDSATAVLMALRSSSPPWCCINLASGWCAGCGFFEKSPLTVALCFPEHKATRGAKPSRCAPTAARTI